MPDGINAERLINGITGTFMLSGITFCAYLLALPPLLRTQQSAKYAKLWRNVSIASFTMIGLVDTIESSRLAAASEKLDREYKKIRKQYLKLTLEVTASGSDE